ncbi:MAG TPA: branched-chain amino acid ABC transporter permease [Clostridiales bacterium]|nr:branched-chain amino acid ABC transporter permease [Clostridiales bacterium]
MKFLSTLIDGLSLGGVYALIALGYTMVYGIAKMLNFAHGDIIMVGGYVIYVIMLRLGGEAIPAVLAALAACCLLGVTVEKVAYKPLRGASPLAVLITAIGVSYCLESLAQIIFSSDPKTVIISDALNNRVGIGSFSISYATLLTLGVTIVIMVALTLYIKFSKTGRAMVATSEDRGAAQLMGVNVNKIITITFAIGSVLAGVASAFYLIKTPTVTNAMGAMPGIKAFTAAVIGGIGSIPGAMLGGILLGVLECFSNSVPALAPYTDAIEFGILIILLLVRPNGILGKKRREKV